MSVRWIGKLGFGLLLLRLHRNTVRRCPRSFGEAGPCTDLVAIAPNYMAFTHPIKGHGDISTI
jgi:hypothetical protein